MKWCVVCTGDRCALCSLPVLPTHPPSADMTQTIVWVTVGVVGVAIVFVLATIIVVCVACACGCGWYARQTDFDNNSSSSNR